MPVEGFIRYFRDAAFRASIDEQLRLGEVATQEGTWTTYAIHDPTRTDHLEGRADGLIIYVGQSKQFAQRIRSRFASAGTATLLSRNATDQACYVIMNQGLAPRFTVLERTRSALDSLVSETNWARRLTNRGYPLLNRWAEHRDGGSDVGRGDVPHKRIWLLTVEDAIGSEIKVYARDALTRQKLTLDLATFPSQTRLYEIREGLRSDRVQTRLQVR